MKHASVKQLEAKVRRLELENAALRKRVAELEAQAARLQAEVEAARRTSKRQAAPFSKGAPRQNPKTPGRKAGQDYGPKAHRPPPAPEQIDEEYDVPLPEGCPHCGGAVEETDVACQYQVEIPQRPIYRQFNVHRGHCVECGRNVQGRHPLQTSDALGAAASQLGPIAQAAVVFLNKYAGLSHGKIVQVFAHLFGVSLSRGGSVQVILRAARRSQPVYQKIVQATRASPWAVPDETGWRIGGQPAWLHVVVGEQSTCYQVAESRSADTAADVLGWNYRGTLIHDGWSPYDRFRLARHQQCVRHLLRRALELLEKAVGGAVHFPARVLLLFQESLALRDRFEQGRASDDDLAEGYLRLLLELEHLVETPKQNADNQRLANHLADHLREWFWFLLAPGLDATNYRAEQAIRLGVVNRKVWGGNRTDRGAKAQGVLMTLIETCRRQGRGVIHYFGDLLCGHQPILLPER